VNRSLVLVAALSCGTLLTACGSSSSTAPHVTDPTVRVLPNVAEAPTWGGCQEHSMRFLDYAAEATGTETREAALAPYRAKGDLVVDRPARPHRNAQVLLVDRQNLIRSALEVLHSPNGWLVSMVEECAD
jgi:hypothetical protein